MAGHAGGAIARIGNTLHPLRENGPERNIVKESEIIDEGGFTWEEVSVWYGSLV